MTTWTWVCVLAEVKHQPDITWFVPMGVAEWLKDNTDVNHATREMSWWQEAQVPDTQVKILP